jgi:2-keto-3-deoxy-L-rhamnonate aldolase RhmA
VSAARGVSEGAASGFLARLRAGELTLLLGVRSSRGAEIVRVAHATGHHGILIDLEHSTMSLDDAARMCATADDLGLTAFVRLPEREYGTIGRLLDGGAAGIIAPRVETTAEARSIAGAWRFPPQGQRSQIATVPQHGMRPTAASVLNPLLDDATIVQILLETPSGIANADAIAQIDGVDMLAIGVNDLTAELGVPGEYADPRVRDAIATVGEACQRHGKLLMVGGVADLEAVASFAALGVCPLQLTGMDTDLLFAEAQARASRWTAWHDALVTRSSARSGPQ